MSLRSFRPPYVRLNVPPPPRQLFRRKKRLSHAEPRPTSLHIWTPHFVVMCVIFDESLGPPEQFRTCPSFSFFPLKMPLPSWVYFDFPLFSPLFSDGLLVSSHRLPHFSVISRTSKVNFCEKTVANRAPQRTIMYEFHPPDVPCPDAPCPSRLLLPSCVLVGNSPFSLLRRSFPMICIPQSHPGLPQELRFAFSAISPSTTCALAVCPSFDYGPLPLPKFLPSLFPPLFHNFSRNV